MKLGNASSNVVASALPACVRRTRSGHFACAVLAACAALSATDAMSATFRYSATSNRIYVENGGLAKLSDIKAAVPAAPLDLVDAANKIWLLRADLVVEDGTQLDIHGEAVGGDVNQLRLQSNATDQGGIISIKAEFGTLNFNSTRVIGWDTSAGRADAEYATHGRAFIRVRSYLDVDGVTPRESRMDILSSEMSFLGFGASESSGLVWKVTGTDPNLYNLVNVYGDIKRSKIHHNFAGIYTTGHEGGEWSANAISYNVESGIDAHDQSNGVLIRSNNVHHNGKQGIMVTRSRSVRVLKNRSWANTDNGILMTRGTRNSIVADNRSYQNTDAGIVLFAANNIRVLRNFSLDNLHGIRVAVGASDNTIEANELGNSSGFGIYVQKDDVLPEPGSDGRPQRNAFLNNNVHDALVQGVKVVEADETSFVGNTFTNVAGPFYLQYASKTELAGNTLPAGLVLKQLGTAALINGVTVMDQNAIPLEFDAYSIATFNDTGNRIYDVTQNVSATALPSRAELRLTSARLGSTVATVLRRELWATPSSLKALINPTTWDTTTDLRKIWRAQMVGGTASVSYVVGDLTPGANYTVTQNTVAIGTFTATAAGRISFAVTPPDSTAMTYAVRPAL